MRTFRMGLRSLATPCLAFCAAALLMGTLGVLSAEALQTASSSTLPLDEYEKLRAQVLKNATDLPGPRLRNPAISGDGLALDVFRALQEQRSYLERHGAVTRTALNPESASDNYSDPPAPRHVTCHKPMIRSVNGKTTGVVFTPMASNNIYKIEGCFFGDEPGIVQLEAHTAAPQAKSVRPITMQLDSASPGTWSDNELRVRLDTSLSGIPDYPVTLVIYPSKRRRIELRGCRFVAARGNPQLLSVIPSAWVNLYPSGVGSRSISRLEYFSPTQASDAVPTGTTASSAFVVRSDQEQFGIGSDVFDFSRLNPGWVVESIQLQTYSVSCPEVVTTVQSFGRWEAEWSARGLRVAFEDSVCTSSVPPAFTFHMSLSQYAIRVWIVGPVGTQPLALAP